MRALPARKTMLVLLVLLALAGPNSADTYYMTDGDRVTGKTLSEAAGFYKVDTPYGRVAIPKGRVARIVRDDGREDVLSAPTGPDHPPAQSAVHLVVVITGATFWQAWSGKDAPPADPSLRLELSLDEEPIVDYVDGKTDPDIPGAIVNAFSFAPADVTVQPGGHAKILAPEVRPGRITLKADLPAEAVGERSFRFAYQMNDGTAGSPAWRNLVETAIHLKLKPESPTIVEVHQDRGGMEFSGLFKKKMKK